MNIAQRKKKKNGAYHRHQAVTEYFVDECIIVIDAFLVDVAGKTLRHDPRPRYGETVELHLRKYNSNIRAVPVCVRVFVCVWGGGG
jgi:hypothetical protein